MKYFALLTKLGENLLAQATALGTKLELTHMAVGDGGGSLPTPDTNQTKLIAEKRRAAINTLFIDDKNKNQIIAEQIIPEQDGGWWIREIGLFDKAGNLIAVANCPETYKPQLAEGSGRTQSIRMVLIVSHTESVTLKIDPSVVLATREYVNTEITVIDKKIDALSAQTKLDLNKKLDKANISGQKGNDNDKVPSLGLFTTEVGKLQPSGNYLKVGDGGWMKDIGVSLNNTAKLSNYRINSIGYAYASISTDTFKGTNNLIFNLFGYLNNKYGAQIAVIPNTSGDIGFRVISNDVVGEWMELAKKSYVDNAVSGLISEITFKAELNKKFNISDITQTSGTSTTKVPSQNAVTIWMSDRYTKAQIDSLLNNKMNTGAGGWMANRGVALTSSSKLADYRLNSIGYAWNTVSSDLFLGANNLFLNLFGYTDSTYGAQLAVIPSVGNERIGFRVIQSNNVGGWIEFATKNYVDSITLGKGQKYYSDTKSAGTTYTNTSSSAIYVCVNINQSSIGQQGVIHGTVDGMLITRQSCYGQNTFASVSFIVPSGSTYSVSMAGDVRISEWRELK
ncbi:phage tail protein [Providencia sp. PROV116]|nr:phage tail protein [Providencia sp. PROV116]